MKKPASYNAPVWVMGVIAVLEVISIWYSLYIDITTAGFNSSPVLFVVALLWPMVFIVQTFLYWLIRKRAYPRFLAWTHLACIIVSFLIPMVLVVLVFGGPVRAGTLVYMHDIISYVPKGLMIIGNVFFILTIVKAFSTNSAPIIEDEPSTYPAD